MTSSPAFLRTAVLGAFFVTAATDAYAVTVTRCNINQDGVFRPALKVSDGQSTETFAIGQDGLTRRLIFDDAAVVAWVEAKFGGNVIMNDCSNLGDSSPTLVAAPPTPPAVAAPPSGCGPCGGCGPVVDVVDVVDESPPG